MSALPIIERPLLGARVGRKGSKAEVGYRPILLKNSGLGSSVESYSGASSNGSLAPRRFIWFFLLVLIGDYAGAGYC